jgi:hypothetical protein
MRNVAGYTVMKSRSFQRSLYVVKKERKNICMILVRKSHMSFSRQWLAHL